jgi:hypothetical protein
MVYVRRGKTTANIVRSCETVRAGAFFPQAQLQVPQKEMRQHGRQGSRQNDVKMHAKAEASIFQ